MDHTLTLTAQLEVLRADLSALESDTPRLEQMVQEALSAVNIARASLKVGEVSADTLTFASGKHHALSGLLTEHLGEVSSLQSSVSSLESRIFTLGQEARRQARLKHLRQAVSTLEGSKKACLETLKQQVSEAVDTFAVTEKALNLAKRELIQLDDGKKDMLNYLHPEEDALQAVVQELFNWYPIWNRIRTLWDTQGAKSMALVEQAGAT